LYQCRYKLADGTWHRQSTRKASIEQAIAAACNIYDEARFRQRLGLAHRAQTFAHIAAITLAELRQQMDLGHGKSVYNTYITCIERYFLPYFGERQLELLTHTDIVEFELWRNRQMNRTPKASTLMNFASTWNKLISVAVARGYISERVPVPKMTTRGEKGKTREMMTTRCLTTPSNPSRRYRLNRQEYKG
jgi:integrase